MPSILEKPAVRRAALPISVEQYHRLSAAGIVTERTELFRRVIIERTTQSALHTYVVQLLAKWLESVISDGVYLRQEAPLSLVDSEPEPDVAVVRGAPRQYRSEHPRTAGGYTACDRLQDPDRYSDHWYFCKPPCGLLPCSNRRESP